MKVTKKEQFSVTINKREAKIIRAIHEKSGAPINLVFQRAIEEYCSNHGLYRSRFVGISKNKADELLMGV